MADWSYVAGLIDGEECISISKESKRVGKLDRYFPKISIGMCDEQLLQVAEEARYGNVFFRAPQKKGWKGTYIWQIQDMNQIEKLLSKIKRHLRFKKAQAYLMLEFISLRKGVHDLRLLSDEDREEYQSQGDEIYLQIKALNEKGA